jgi:exopolysaccharide biosynthesis polyprenyl glycosylphosphotransferase
VVKRLVDIIVASLGLVILLPVFLAVAVLIKLTSRGRVFYRQERMGLDGRRFKIIKFRTMVRSAEGESGPVMCRPGDPRMTKVGRFLRKFSIDEFPQLVNVLKGEMSLIGPRPERPFFVDQLQRSIPFYRTRLTVRPGLTGWAQVNYRYGSSEEDALVKLKYDLYYIRHQSILLDLLILLRTVAKVIRMQGN